MISPTVSAAVFFGIIFDAESLHLQWPREYAAEFPLWIFVPLLIVQPQLHWCWVYQSLTPIEDKTPFAPAFVCSQSHIAEMLAAVSASHPTVFAYEWLVQWCSFQLDVDCSKGRWGLQALSSCSPFLQLRMIRHSANPRNQLLPAGKPHWMG